MIDVLSQVAGVAVSRFEPGQHLVSEGETTGQLMVLRSGSVEIIRDGIVIAGIDAPGAVFGEMALLLERPHSASVRALTPVEAHVIEDGRGYLDTRPLLALQIAVLLAGRLQATSDLLTRARQAGAPIEPPRNFLDRLMGALTGTGRGRRADAGGAGI